MHQRGRLQGLAGLFVGQLLGRQLAKFVVDQQQELIGGVRVALLDGGQDVGDFTHWRLKRLKPPAKCPHPTPGTGSGKVNLDERGTVELTGLFPATELDSDYTHRLATSPEVLRHTSDQQHSGARGV